jgi:hypothetical protein
MQLSLTHVVEERERRDAPPVKKFERHENALLVDVTDVLTRLNDTGKFDDAIIESWFARQYCKAWGIPCVSMRLFDFKEPCVPYERMRVTLTAQRLCIDPIQYLPSPEPNWLDDEGIYFFIKGNYLAMGNSRAIEQCWRNLYP